jgi:hypothetical protein
MKIGVLAVGIALAGSAVATTAAAGASAGTAHSAAACVPSIKSVGGHSSIGYCGPATATLTIAGKIYSFKGGTCQKDPAAHSILSLTLGTIVVKSSTNGGLPMFGLSIVADGSLKIETVTADWGGKQLASVDDVTLKGSIPSAGTFTSTKSVFGGSHPFTGTWNCHGLVSSIA